jgi:23S rRNA (adenine2503-C2)-methyltransferase
VKAPPALATDPEPVISLHDAPALAALAREHRTDPQHLAKLTRRVLQHGDDICAALTSLKTPLPAPLVARLTPGALILVKRRDSARDGATKLLFQTRAGERIESVLLRARSGRTTLCLSIQSGCAFGCSFCASGASGLRARLTLDEVLAQVIHGRQIAASEGLNLRNLVFMGMGEPLAEEALLHDCLERLTTATLFGFSPRRVCVSTVGLPEEMVRLAQRFPSVRQALSLHSAVANERAALIPVAREHSLDDLRRAALEVTRLAGGRILIEYLLLAGRTDRPEDERALYAWLDGLSAHLNLIPYNPIWRIADHTPTPHSAALAFARRCRARGIPTTLRRSLGTDISAACGALTP